jgi:ribosome-associated toxin RatA of RatAB toxin-antitoxin module
MFLLIYSSESHISILVETFQYKMHKDDTSELHRKSQEKLFKQCLKFISRDELDQLCDEWVLVALRVEFNCHQRLSEKLFAIILRESSEMN